MGEEQKEDFISREAVGEANQLLNMLALLLRAYPADKLKELVRAHDHAEGAAPVFMAFGASDKWLDTLIAKKKALEYLLEIRELMDKRVL